MYSKQEASFLRHEFWTAFGKYISLHLSAQGEKINWINYKTGERHIAFKMNADNHAASIAIELTHPDVWLREIYFEQFVQLKKLLHAAVGEEWNWALHTHDDNGKMISRIYTGLQPVNIFNKEDWPALISFFKPRIIALDAFWSDARYGFEALGS